MTERPGPACGGEAQEMAGGTGTHVREAVLSLLAARVAGGTVCPSEVARTLAGGAAADWRSMMPAVHAATDALVAEGLVRLSWKGRPLAVRAGPYRIGRRRGD